jgi:hypothetical protein
VTKTMVSDNSTTCTTRCTSLISGSFINNKVNVQFETNMRRQHSNFMGEAQPYSSHSLPDLADIGGVNGSDDDDDDNDDSTNIENSSELWGETSGAVPSDFEFEIRQMVDALTEEELEVAARSSYGYAKLSASSYKSCSNTSTVNKDILKDSRQCAVSRMAVRHWIAEKGNTQLALQRMRQAIQHRPRIDVIRDCCRHHDKQSLVTRQLIQHYLGPQGRMFVRGYDKDGRAIFHFIVTNSPRNKDSAEGCIEAYVHNITTTWMVGALTSHSNMLSLLQALLHSRKSDCMH